MIESLLLIGETRLLFMYCRFHGISVGIVNSPRLPNCSTECINRLLQGEYDHEIYRSGDSIVNLHAGYRSCENPNPDALCHATHITVKSLPRAAITLVMLLHPSDCSKPRIC